MCSLLINCIMIILFITFVTQWKTNLVTMVNIKDFSSRLQMLMEYYQFSASAFADEIDFNRSTISHLISGRNKPSLDFVLKVLERFPEVNMYWLVYGQGNFPNDSPSTLFTSSQIKNEIKSDPIIEPKDENITEDKVLEIKTQEKPISPSQKSVSSLNSDKEIAKIVIFYTDSTFEVFEN